MILHRHLQSLLHRMGIDEERPPDEDRWLALLVLLNDRFRQFEEERHRLQRSLDVHAREVQSLYKELTLERDKTASALACVDQGLILLDAQGRPLLLSAEAERLLGWAEAELEGKDLFAALGLERLIPRGGLAELLQKLRPLRFSPSVQCRPEARALDLELQPLIRERQLVGCLLLLKEPVAAEVVPEPEPEPAPATVEDLPAVAEVLEERAPAAPRASGRARNTQGLRLLLVENDSAAAQASQELIESLNHRVELVSSAEEALRRYRKKPYDAVLCCEGPEALELCRKLRQDSRGSYPYFILMTEGSGRPQATRALEAGVDAFLSKPLEASELGVRLKVAKGVQSRLNRVYSGLLPAQTEPQ